MSKSTSKLKKERSQVYEEIVEAYGLKYSWLGAQAAREMLISASTWNLQRYSDPPYRFRTHMMLAWERGYLKSTMMRVMKDILGDEFCSTIGKVSDAAMRGSLSGNTFTPPKPLRTPIVISTEFGQTDFSDELLNLFLALLEEGTTNVALNKVGQLPEKKRRAIEEKYDSRVQFKETNEFNITTDFVFWGGTYDPTKLADDALRSRFTVVTPSKALSSQITKAADNNPSVQSQLSKSTVRRVREALRCEKEFSTDFKPPDNIYSNYSLTPRESRDVQAYMAARNWWGLEVNPEIMSDFVEHLKESRKLATMKPDERVFELIFDEPRSYDELKSKTGLGKKTLFKVLNRMNAENYIDDGETKWVIWSEDNKKRTKNQTPDSLEDIL